MTIHQFLHFYYKYAMMEANKINSSIVFHKIVVGQHNVIKALLNFQESYFNMGLNYFGFICVTPRKL
jgi:hypothetical protein